MLKQLLGTALVMCIFSLGSNAQSVEKMSDGYVHERTPIEKHVTNDTIKDAQPKEKVQFNMSMGTGVSFGGSGTGTCTWLAPNMSYRVSPRFTIATGLRLAMNTGNRYAYSFADGSNMSFVRPTTSYLMYASGSYDMSPKIRLTGTVYTGTQVFDLPGMRPSSYNLNTYGGSLNVEYKLSEHSSISAGIGISHGPAYGSPSMLHDNNPVPIR